MPRHGRILSESKVYHVMMRGNEKKNIFLDNEDNEKLLEIIVKTKEKGWFIYAYCLMDNHVHLIINEGDDQIARIMKRINTSYACNFNKKYQRVGHLFQDRYKSEVIQTEKYLLAAVRYLHNNPVKAGKVSTPDQYEWSSYNEYIAREETPLINKKDVLNLFSDNAEIAIKQFVEFSWQDNDDAFLDYHEDEPTKMSQEEVEFFVRAYLEERGINKEMLKNKANKYIREELIRDLKDNSHLSIREIARIIGLNKNMIQRIQ